MRNTIMLIIVLCSISYGDICNIAGFISDNGPAAEGTEVLITNLEYDVTYRTVTGTGWPYPNYYLQTITCDVGKHQILVMATRDGRTARATIVPDSRLVQVNLSLPSSPAIPDSPKQDSSKSGGGGGGSGGVPVVDTRLDSTYDVARESSLSIFTTDRWFNLERYVLNVTDISGDSVTIELPGQTMTLNLGKNTTADVNLDGIQDYAIYLESIEGRTAHVRFFKIWNPILVEAGIQEEAPRPAIEEERQNPADLVYLVGICVVLMALAILMMLKKRGAKQ